MADERKDEELLEGAPMESGTNNADSDTMPTEAAAPTTPSSKDAWTSGIRAKNPYLAEDDEEGLYKAAMDGYDKEHEYAKKMRDENGRLQEAIEASPEIAAFMGEVYERGKDGHPEMAFHALGDLIKAYATGEITSEEYLAEKEKRSKAESEKAKRLEAQDEAFVKWCEEKGYDPKEWMDKANERLFSKMSEFNADGALFDVLDNMLNYEGDVNDARESGRVQGRNESIAAKMEKEQKNDGLINGSRGGAAPIETPQEEEDKFDRMLRRRQARMS